MLKRENSEIVRARKNQPSYRFTQANQTPGQFLTGLPRFLL